MWPSSYITDIVPMPPAPLIALGQEIRRILCFRYEDFIPKTIIILNLWKYFDINDDFRSKAVPKQKGYVHNSKPATQVHLLRREGGYQIKGHLILNSRLSL